MIYRWFRYLGVLVLAQVGRGQSRKPPAAPALALVRGAACPYFRRRKYPPAMGFSFVLRSGLLYLADVLGYARRTFAPSIRTGSWRRLSTRCCELAVSELNAKRP